LHFAPDVEDTLEFTVAFGNTVSAASRSGVDEIATIHELHDLLDVQKFGGSRQGTRAELADAIETRARLRAMWTLERDDLADEINAILREAQALPQLNKHDAFDWHIHAVPMDAPLGERIRVEVALALADVIRADATDRLRICEAPDCEGLLVDVSRNGSKRFCSVRCGNRMNMIAYRERQGAGDD
jgi:predicted RNA-binding Zn ribbon-like protein